jgi:hypothetical protein
MRAAVPHIDWQKLYEAAMLEINPDELPTRIEAAEQAIAQRDNARWRMPVQCSKA